VKAYTDKLIELGISFH